MKRQRHHDTPLAHRLRRLRLTLRQAERITRAPYGNLKAWKQGRYEAPRTILRLLAAWRLIHWGRY